MIALVFLAVRAAGRVAVAFLLVLALLRSPHLLPHLPLLRAHVANLGDELIGMALRLVNLHAELFLNLPQLMIESFPAQPLAFFA